MELNMLCPKTIIVDLFIFQITKNLHVFKSASQINSIIFDNNSTHCFITRNYSSKDITMNGTKKFEDVTSSDLKYSDFLVYTFLNNAGHKQRKK